MISLHPGKAETVPIIEEVLWKNPGHPGMIVVTSHASILEDGKLYMKEGAAFEATRRIPGIEKQCASQILAHAIDGVYGFLPVRPSRPHDKIVGFGIFQTRVHWTDCADPDLIRYSMECLRQYIAMNANLKVRMNCPGVDEGDLPFENVAPLLAPLPPTVTICFQGEVGSQLLPGLGDVKDLFIQTERMLQEGRFNLAVEQLVYRGVDYQTAVEQVTAVQHMLRDKAEKDAERVRRWRGSHS